MDDSGENVVPQHVNFSCIADGNEAPTITWFFNYGRLAAGPMIEFEGLETPPEAIISDDGALLTIRHVHVSVLGDFSCIATNSLGRDISNGELVEVRF